MFGKVGRVASSEVVVQLFKSKCLPVMYYGLEACPVNKSQTKSFQYVLNCCFVRCTISIGLASSHVSLYFDQRRLGGRSGGENNMSIRLGHQKRSLQYASVEANVREGKCDLYTVARIIS